MKKSSVIPIGEIIKIPLFSAMGQEDVLPLIEAAHEKRLHAGEYFYLQGDPAKYMFVLIQGRVKRIQVGQDGRQVLIQVIKPLQPFGLEAMTTTNIYPVTAQATKDSFAVYWAGTELMSYVMKVPQMALNAIGLMADQLNEIQDRFRQVPTQRVEQRFAATLIRLASQSGKRVKEGILIDHALSRQDLAEMSGTTIFTASRTLRQWDERELVIAGRGRVIIRNPHALARIMEGLGN